MIQSTSHHALLTLHEVHRNLINPPKGTLSRWAIEKIDYFHDEGSNTIPYHLAGLLKRLVAIAMPVFAALDALQQGGKMICHLCVLKPHEAFEEMLACGKSLLLFFVSLPLAPLALVSPIAVYRTPERWEAIRNNQCHDGAATIIKMELEAWATDKLTQRAAKKILEAYENRSSELDLNYLKLKDLPPCIGRLTWLKTLKLSFNSFESIPKEIFSLTHLKELHLAGNRIQTISKDIRKLKKLSLLDVSRSELKTLPEEIGELTTLEKLNLSHNKLNSLPTVVGKLIGLKCLNMRFNNISCLPKEIGALAQLKEFIVGNNQLTHLCSQIGNLTKLEILDASHNLLDSDSLPSEFGKLTKLTKLNLSHNRLETLPSTLGSLKKLKSLDLSENKLKSLSKVIGQFTGLEKLNASNNQITTLSKKIRLLKELVVLNINNNNLEELPPEIGQLPRLDYLNLRFNKLTTLPKEVGQLAFLEMLYVENNKLNSLPEEIAQLSLLRGLFLSRNEFESILPDIGGLPRLEMLTLATNQLTSLPWELGQLVQLKILDLRQNTNLNELPIGLGQAPELTIIDIEETGISKELRDAILMNCQASRKEAAVKILPWRLEAWKVAGKSEFVLSDIEKFEESQKIQINNWLVRLERTKDFRSDTQESLAGTVCEMLCDVIKNGSFKDLFFTQIAANLEGCEDRAAMALNEIYTSWRLSKLDDEASLNERLQMMARGAKTLALRAAIANCIDKRQKVKGVVEKEAVEIYLYYETALKSDLNLLCATEKMAFGQIGKRDWISTENLVATVFETYLDHLIAFPDFEKMIIKEEEYHAACEKYVEPLDDKVLDVLEKEPQGVDELSTAYLNWQSKVGELNLQRQQALAKIKKNWALQKLKFAC